MLSSTIYYVPTDDTIARKLLRVAVGISLTMAGHSGDTLDISTSTQVDAGLAQGANEVVYEVSLGIT